MKLKVPAPILKAFGRHTLTLQKQSPTIMMAAGVVGVVGTTVLACRATLKVHDVLDERESTLAKIKSVNVEKYSEQDRVKDLAILHTQTVVKIAKLYVPAVTVGVTSVALLIGSHRIMSTRNAGLMAAYASLDKGFKEYRERVLGELGEEKDREFRYGKELEVVREDDGTTYKTIAKSVNGRSIYARVFDENTSQNWQPEAHYNQMFLRSQQNFANDLLKIRGHVILNDVHDMLGLERTKEGAVVGWVKDSKDGDNYIDFGIFTGDMWSAMQFVNGDESSVWLDFNVDGVVYDKI